jgi:hypothetical protein
MQPLKFLKIRAILEDNLLEIHFLFYRGYASWRVVVNIQGIFIIPAVSVL